MLAYLKFEQYIVFCIAYIYPLMHIFGHKKLKVSVFRTAAIFTMQNIPNKKNIGNLLNYK